MRRERGPVLRLAALAVAVMAIAGSPLHAERAVVGKPAPSFVLRLVDGGNVTSESLRGKVVVLNYWATWCVPCKRELPLLDAYYRATEQHGLRVFAITTEDSIPMSKLKPLRAVMAIPFVARMRGDYGILKGVPTNYVIDRQGVVRHAKAAALDLDDLNNILIPLLQEAAPPTP